MSHTEWVYKQILEFYWNIFPFLIIFWLFVVILSFFFPRTKRDILGNPIYLYPVWIENILNYINKRKNKQTIGVEQNEKN